MKRLCPFFLGSLILTAWCAGCSGTAQSGATRSGGQSDGIYGGNAHTAGRNTGYTEGQTTNSATNTNTL